MKITAVVGWLAAALFSTTTAAEGFRCNGDLAGPGDSKASVLQKCGAPFFAETFCKPFNTPDRDDDAPRWVVPCVPVDEWSYNPGSGQFITILRFEGGVMTFIRYGARIR